MKKTEVLDKFDKLLRKGIVNKDKLYRELHEITGSRINTSGNVSNTNRNNHNLATDDQDDNDTKFNKVIIYI